jgi:hypothetical protein
MIFTACTHREFNRAMTAHPFLLRISYNKKNAKDGRHGTNMIENIPKRGGSKRVSVPVY